MSDPESYPSKPATLVAGFLLAAGLAGIGAGLWLGRIDFARIVERQVTRAHGTLSTETATWLHESHFSTRLMFGGLGLLGLGLTVVFLRKQLSRLFDRWATGKTGMWDYASATLLVVVWYFPTLRSGFFRYDDFELLTVAQEGSFWTTLWQPHGDHVLPLTRVLAWAALHLFGIAATPYNLWLWVCLSAVLVTGMALLGEMGAGRVARWVFVVLVAFWSPWAEMMTGYYILSTYLVIGLLGLGTAWFYLRVRRTGQRTDAIGLAACALLAPLVDVSGGYVLGIGAVFLAHDFAANHSSWDLRGWVRDNRIALLGLAAATALSGLVLLYAYRIVNPGVFLGMAAGEGRTLGQIGRDLGYLLGSGTLLSLATPFVYARLPAGVLAGLTLAAVIFGGLFFLMAFRSADRARQGLLGAIMLVVLGTGLMVVLGRPPADSWIVRWAAKHLCPVYLWFSLLIAAAWDAWWSQRPREQRGLFAALTAMALVGFIALQTGFGLLGMAVAFPPFGYPAEIRDAARRRAAITTLRDQVTGTIAARLGPHATVPTLDGAQLQQHYPSLFSYNLSHYRPFLGESAAGLTWVRNAAMQSWHAASVRTVPILRDAVSPETSRLLASDPVLRSFYFAEVSLEAHFASTNLADIDHLAAAPSGRPLMLRTEPWDPEVHAVVQFGTDRAGVSETAEITVIFWSELLQADWRGTVMLPRGTGRTLEVDLRQVPAYALSRRVSNLRVLGPPAGGYWFRLAESSP